MGIRSVWGQPVGHQEIVLRARPTTTFPPPFPIRALGPAIILLMTVIGMSQLGPIDKPPLHEGALSMVMTRPPTTSSLFGIPTALTSADVSTYADAPPAVITAATEIREQVEPGVTVVSAASHTPPAAAIAHPVTLVVSTVLRAVQAAAVTGPESTVISAALNTSPSVAAAMPAHQRAHGKSKHTTRYAKATKTRAGDRGSGSGSGSGQASAAARSGQVRADN